MRKQLILSAIVLGIVLLIVSSIGLVARNALGRVTAKEQKLVYRTDHAALLAACKQVLADPQAFGADKNGSIEGPWGSGLPANPKLPPAIRDLDFEVINVNSTSQPPSMEILFGGGFYHYGFETPTPLPRGGIKELIPGLWYWNESGQLPPNPAKWQFPIIPAVFVLSWLILAGSIFLLIPSRKRVPESGQK